MTKFIIREFNENVELLLENVVKVKDDYVYKNVLLQKADTRNGNGRIYPLKVLQKQVSEYKDKINNKQAVGELGHPERADVDPKLISHHIDDIWMSGTEVRGDVRVLSKTTQGSEAVKLIESDIKLGLSSRGLGSVVNKTNYVEVQDDFSFVCWDIVIDPSTAKAYLNESRTLIPYSQNSVVSEEFNKYANFMAKKYKRG
jgi:hypothetical protein